MDRGLYLRVQAWGYFSASWWVSVSTGIDLLRAAFILNEVNKLTGVRGKAKTSATPLISCHKYFTDALLPILLLFVLLMFTFPSLCLHFPHLPSLTFTVFSYPLPLFLFSSHSILESIACLPLWVLLHSVTVRKFKYAAHASWSYWISLSCAALIDIGIMIIWRKDELQENYPLNLHLNPTFKFIAGN